MLVEFVQVIFGMTCDYSTVHKSIDKKIPNNSDKQTIDNDNDLDKVNSALQDQ